MNDALDLATRLRAAADTGRFSPDDLRRAGNLIASIAGCEAAHLANVDDLQRRCAANLERARRAEAALEAAADVIAALRRGRGE